VSPRSARTKRRKLEPEDDEEADGDELDGEEDEEDGEEDGEEDDDEADIPVKKGAAAVAAKVKSAAAVSHEDDADELEANGEDED
jgi:hypothetical protein